MIRIPPTEQLTPPASKPRPNSYAIPQLRIHYPTTTFSAHRIKVHQPTTTPVTTRKPLIHLNGRTSSTATPTAVKRKLFTVSTPAKKSRAASLSTPPSFRISGNKARTQPLEQRRVKNVCGVLGNVVKREHGEAGMNLATIRNGKGREFYKVMEKSLVVQAVRKVGEMMVGRLWKEQVEIGVVCDMIECDHDAVLIIPQPWYVMHVEGVVQSGLMIVAHRVGVLTDMNLLNHVVVNVALGRWLRKGDVFGSQYMVPDSQEEDGMDEDGDVVTRFGLLSMHSPTVRLQICDVFSLSPFQICVVTDAAGEFAVYKGELETTEMASQGLMIHVQIEAERFAVSTLLNIAACTNSASSISKQLQKLNRASTLLVVAPVSICT